MYKKTSRKYSSICHEKTGKIDVLPDFLYDIEHCNPDFIRETKSYISVFFSGKYSDLYILPLSCKKYLKGDI